MKKLADKKGTFIYNLGSGKGHSVFEIIKAYEKANSVKINFKIVNRRAGDIAINYANCNKAKKELGFVCKYNIIDACKHDFLFRQKFLNK